MNQSFPLHGDRQAGSRVAFIQACWHKEIVDEARLSFLAGLERLGHGDLPVETFEVPGSLEIPLQAKLLAATGRYAVVVAAGLVVDGGIYCHDFVAATVIDALMRVQLDSEVPILSVVLTPQSFRDGEPLGGLFREHFKVKGAEAAAACVQTLGNLRRLAALADGTAEASLLESGTGRP